MLNSANVPKFLQNNLEYLQRDHRITGIDIVGYFARDEQTEKSDIDLLLEFEPGTENLYDKKLRLRNDFKTHLDRDIDTCREKYIKLYLRNYLFREMVWVLYCLSAGGSYV